MRQFRVIFAELPRFIKKDSGVVPHGILTKFFTNFLTKLIHCCLKNSKITVTFYDFY